MIDRRLLSPREDEVLELALAGLSDREIAHKMGLSPATVNSYWVRIRGKLGHLSRTEFVGQLLRQDTEEKLNSMAKDHAKVQALADARAADRLALKLAHFYKAPLEAVPEALLVIEAGGVIEFANARACTLLGMSNSELVGQNIRQLFPRHVAGSQYEMMRSALSAVEPSVLGIRSVFQIRRERAQDTRVVLKVSPTNSTSGQIAVVLISLFLDELNRRREQLQSLTAHRQ